MINLLFWIGGILGALLLLVGVYMLTGPRKKLGAAVFGAGVIFALLLLPVFQPIHDVLWSNQLNNQPLSYRNIGFVGVALLFLGFLTTKVKVLSGGLIGLGAVLASYLLPAFGVAYPASTTLVQLLNNPSAAVTAPDTNLLDSDPTDVPSTISESPSQPTQGQGETEFNQPDTLPSNQPDTLPSNQTDAAPSATPDQPNVLPDTNSGTDAPQGASDQPLDTNQDQVQQWLDDNAPESSTDTAPNPTVPSTVPSTAPSTGASISTTQEEVCPCVLKVVTNVPSNIRVMGDNNFYRDLKGNEAVFTNLPVGNYQIMVEAAGYNSQSTQLRLGNNKVVRFDFSQ